MPVKRETLKTVARWLLIAALLAFIFGVIFTHIPPGNCQEENLAPLSGSPYPELCSWQDHAGIYTWQLPHTPDDDYQGVYCIAKVPPECPLATGDLEDIAYFNVYTVALAQHSGSMVVKQILVGVGWLWNWGPYPRGRLRLFTYDDYTGHGYYSDPLPEGEWQWVILQLDVWDESGQKKCRMLASAGLGDDIDITIDVDEWNWCPFVMQAVATEYNFVAVDTPYSTKMHDIMIKCDDDWHDWNGDFLTESFRYGVMKWEKSPWVNPRTGTYEFKSYCEFEAQLELNDLYSADAALDLYLNPNVIGVEAHFKDYDEGTWHFGSTIVSGTGRKTGTWTVEHPEGRPIEKVRVAIRGVHDGIERSVTLTNHTVHKNDLRERLKGIMVDWFKYPGLQDAFRDEIEDILIQWFSAPS